MVAEFPRWPWKKCLLPGNTVWCVQIASVISSFYEIDLIEWWVIWFLMSFTSNSLGLQGARVVQVSKFRKRARKKLIFSKVRRANFKCTFSKCHTTLGNQCFWMRAHWICLKARFGNCLIFSETTFVHMYVYILNYKHPVKIWRYTNQNALSSNYNYKYD